MAKTNLGKVSITPKGAYNELTTYEKLDVVSYNGSSFLVLKNVQGVVPIDDEENYMLLAKKGENGSGGGSSYSLPIAAPDTLGGVQPVAKTSEMTEAVGVDGTGKLFTKPGASGGGGSYTLPVASADTLGGIKVGANLSITPAGVLSATGGGGSEGGGSSSEKPWVLYDTKEVTEPQNSIEFTLPNVDEIFVDFSNVSSEGLSGIGYQIEKGPGLWTRYNHLSIGNIVLPLEGFLHIKKEVPGVFVGKISVNTETNNNDTKFDLRRVRANKQTNNISYLSFSRGQMKDTPISGGTFKLYVRQGYDAQ